MVWYFLSSEHYITWIFNSILFLWWKCQYSHLANGEIETQTQIWLCRITKAAIMMQLNIWAAPRSWVLCHRNCKFHPAPLSRGCCLRLNFRHNVLACNYAFGLNMGTENWQQSQNQKLGLVSSRKSIIFSNFSVDLPSIFPAKMHTRDNNCQHKKTQTSPKTNKNRPQTKTYHLSMHAGVHYRLELAARQIEIVSGKGSTIFKLWSQRTAV